MEGPNPPASKFGLDKAIRKQQADPRNTEAKNADLILFSLIKHTQTHTNADTHTEKLRF